MVEQVPVKDKVRGSSPRGGATIDLSKLYLAPGRCTIRFMLTLILLLVVGLILVYVSQFNFMLVSVNLGFYAFSNIPLFYVIVGSLLFGLVLSYAVYLVHALSASFTIRGKNNEIKKEKDEVLELTKRVHQLELENEKLKHSEDIKPEDTNAL